RHNRPRDCSPSGTSWGRSRGSSSSSSRTSTSSATSWSSGSSRPTGRTPRRRAPNASVSVDARERRSRHRGRQPQRRRGAGGGRRRPGTSSPGRRGSRGRRARHCLRRPGREPHAQAGAPRDRRGDRCPLVADRRHPRPAARASATTRRRRPLPAGGRRRLAPSAGARPAPPARLRTRARDGAARTGAGDVSTQRIPLRERLRRGRAANGAGSLLPGTGEGRRRIPLVESFNYAVEGIIHVLRTHRNMRIHFAAAAAVLILALWIGVDRIELVVLLLAIAFVLIAEMVNSAIEAAIDVATSSFAPLAKLAKDIAAGAVLIASINAIAVGYLVFSGHVNDSTTNFFDRLRDAPIKLTIIALILVIIIVIATKAISGRGTPLRGGLPSGHAAIAFAAWMAVTLTL